MTEGLFAGLLAGYGVAVPMGAIAVLIMGLSARTSLRVGMAAALGVATADGVYVLVAVLGGAALAGAIEPLAGPTRWVAAVVLLALALKTGIGAVRHHRDPATAPRRNGAQAVSGRSEAEPAVKRPESGGALRTPARAFAGLLGLTMLNPTTVVYFAALVLGRRSGDGFTAAGEVVFVAAVFAASASWQLLLAGGGTLVGKALAGPRGRLVTALVSSAVIALLAIGLMLGD